MSSPGCLPGGRGPRGEASKIGGAGVGWHPATQEGLGLRRLFSFLGYLTAQTCPQWPAPSIQTSLPWGLVPNP